ncbi:FANCD2 opposite strand protein isoform X2 [Ornithorhynchus anatinus]|uniref:FANCD2 opposite strand protein isoform X2 n=1 Tax=Ornithorhynchus anatinus TaxID=9258 RepID=UPI0004543B30|nr:FANCD2 opposite strand protein isoform X2 [Ornithorhynchus anatinus]
MADSGQTEETANIPLEESNLQEKTLLNFWSLKPAHHQLLRGRQAGGSLGAEGYQLWSSWTPLDESFQWIRHPVARPSEGPSTSLVSLSETPTDKEVQHHFRKITSVRDGSRLDRNESSHLSPTSKSPKLPRIMEHRTANDTKNGLMKPQPVRLSGLDSVFGRVITAQPPKWTGALRFSEKSAFSKIVSPGQQWPTGLKEPQTEMIFGMCKQMLRAILLLYSTYKKCTFILQHSK